MKHRTFVLEARWEVVFSTSAAKTDTAEPRVELRDVLHHYAMENPSPRSACDELLAEIRQASADIKFWTRVTVVAIPCTMLAALLYLSLFDNARPPPQLIITIPASPPTK
jgi:hypothetical protein